MKFAIAVAMLVVLAGSPLLCLAVPCDFSRAAHECCPRGRELSVCPYDVLETAKVAAGVGLAIVASAETQVGERLEAARVVERAVSFRADQRELYVRLQVLLI